MVLFQPLLRERLLLRIVFLIIRTKEIDVLIILLLLYRGRGLSRRGGLWAVRADGLAGVTGESSESVGGRGNVAVPSIDVGVFLRTGGLGDGFVDGYVGLRGGVPNG